MVSPIGQMPFIRQKAGRKGRLDALSRLGMRPAVGFTAYDCHGKAAQNRQSRNVSVACFKPSTVAPMRTTVDPAFGVTSNVGGNTVACSNSKQITEQHRCNAV